MPLFTVAQIREAINDPLYRSGDPGRPVSYPISGTLNAGVAGPNFAYTIVRPYPNVVTEIRSVYVASDPAAAAMPFVFILLPYGEFLQQVPVIQSIDQWMFLLQQAPGMRGRSVVQSGNTPVAATPGENAFRGLTQQQIHLPNPVVLTPNGRETSTFGVLGLTAGDVMSTSFFGREWPIDTDSYAFNGSAPP